MTAYNIVRFRVKPGGEDGFLSAHRDMVAASLPGMRKIALVKTGDLAYCLVAEWDDFDAIVAARPAMIANLDRIRPLLEDLGGSLGVTDPVSGDAVLEFEAR